MKEKSIKILAVDDEESILEMLKSLLSSQGINHDFANNGLDAIKKIKSDEYDVIITDLRMPGVSGLEVIEEAKKKNPNTQVIMLTGYADLDTAISTLRLGAADLLQKPVKIDFLLNVINKCIEKKRLIDENIILTENLKKNNTELEKALATIKKQHKIILHNERLRALGTMAAGIAHEINNPLVFISANIQTLEKFAEKIKTAETAKNHNNNIFHLFIQETPGILKGIRKGISRMTNIINGLRSFARSDTDREKPERVYISDCLEEAIELCMPLLKNIEVHREKIGSEKTISTIPQHLVQAFVNLLQNAGDAVQEVSSPRIDIIQKSLPDKQIISIQDNGKGIEKEILNHIFEPFFTTKEVGKGTGIGLSITYGIIKKSGGTIEVKSDGKSGTTFQLIWKNYDKNIINNNI